MAVCILTATLRRVGPHISDKELTILGAVRCLGVRTDTGGRLGLEVMPGSVERMDIRVATGSGIRKTVMSVEEGLDNRAELILFLIPVP